MLRYRVMYLLSGWAHYSTLDEAIESAMDRSNFDSSRRYVIQDVSKKEPEIVAYAFRGRLYDSFGNDYYESKPKKCKQPKKFYVYLDTPYGIELIGSTEDPKKAEEIKASKYAKWKSEFLWSTRIEDHECKEFSCFD